MQNEYFAYYILLSIALIYLAIGLWATRSARTLQNYFLANRSLGIFPLSIALITSQLGSGMILGTAQRGYSIGLKAILYTAGLSFGLLILSLGLAARIRGLNIQTVPEIFEKYYNSYRLKIFASTISIISLWGILVAQIVASKSIFISLAIYDFTVFSTVWVFVITYSMLGGLSSIVLINIIQLVFFISIFIIASKWVIPKILFKYISIAKIHVIQHRLFKTAPSSATLCSSFMIPTLYSLIKQNTAQKIFAAKNKITATVACFIAAVSLIGISVFIILFTFLVCLRLTE